MLTTSQEISVSLREIISPSFYDLHRQIQSGGVSEVWTVGGRGSTKSSFDGTEIGFGLEKHSDAHAFISRRYDNEIRDSVFPQMQWAFKKLHVDHLWDFIKSPYEATRKGTGQKIAFRGLDQPVKAKSFSPSFGYVKYFWAEEVDQFGGMEDIRSILQSLFRGEHSGDQIAFFSFNPPKSARSWVNAETKIKKPGRIVHRSTYLTVNPDWLGETFIAGAEHLKRTNPEAYRHEYLGEEIGTGLEVFNNIELREIDDDEIKTFINIRQGIDWGYAVDPVCLERMSYDRKRRTLYVFGEVSGIGVQNRALDDKTPEEWKRTLTRADSAEPKSISEMKLDYSWNIIAATKGKGSVEFGVKWLQSLERIVIDPARCPLAGKEFINYALMVSRVGEVISEFPDKDNHSIDTVRYGCEEWMAPEPKKVPKVVPLGSRWG